MDAYYVRLARESLTKAIYALERAAEQLVQAGQCTPQIHRQQANIRRLQKDQVELMIFLRDGLAEEQ